MISLPFFEQTMGFLPKFEVMFGRYLDTALSERQLRVNRTEFWPGRHEDLYNLSGSTTPWILYDHLPSIGSKQGTTYVYVYIYICMYVYTVRIF